MEAQRSSISREITNYLKSKKSVQRICSKSVRHFGSAPHQKKFFGQRVNYDTNYIANYQHNCLIVSSDINSNPGPNKCPECSRMIAKDHRAVRCDLCLHCYRSKYASTLPSIYKMYQLLNNCLIWRCKKCSLPVWSLRNYFGQIFPAMQRIQLVCVKRSN